MFPIIKTERLILRKPNIGDWKIISYLRSDEKVNRYVKRPRTESKDKALAFIAKINADIVDQSILYWVISERKNDEMIGSICLCNFSENRKIAEVGYDLNPKYQRKGIMDESLKSVLKYGFTNLNLDTITAYTHEENVNSVTLLKRNKFRLVAGKIDSNNSDNIILEVTRSSYNNDNSHGPS